MDIIDELNNFFPDLNNFEYVQDNIFTIAEKNHTAHKKFDLSSK